MKIDQLKDLLSNFDKNVFFEHDLKKKNWFNIGGKSKVFFKADNLNQLINFLKILNNQERIFILGAGSNILVTDNLFDGVVIKLGKNFSQITLHSDDIIIAGSAALDKSLSNFALENHLSGFEFLSCIPGTIGGGISMNAGCFGKEFKDILISIQAIDKLGRVISIPAKEIEFEYRKNNIPEDYIFLSASFKGTKSIRNKIETLTNELKLEKEKNQPSKVKTSGSTFKNPISQTSKKVWQLIQESVPLNQSFGDACISKKHCNFFVNKGEAKFRDMKRLIDFVSEKVLIKTGISLEKEIKILE
tara:strand:+ start:766 stop:1674 length:909 start_codon:yes stop_codon:yes gene_type:complete